VHLELTTVIHSHEWKGLAHFQGSKYKAKEGRGIAFCGFFAPFLRLFCSEDPDTKKLASKGPC
jgi:hypothetical protein